MFTVYAYVEPETNIVRYIGCTSFPPERRLETQGVPVGPWRDELRKRGLEPKIVVLFQSEVHMLAAEEERRWIVFLRTHSQEKHFNKQVGARYPALVQRRGKESNKRELIATARYVASRFAAHGFHLAPHDNQD